MSKQTESCHLISLGAKCGMKYQIDQFLRCSKTGPTYPFDWVESNFAAIISLLREENLDDILTFENMVIELSQRTRTAHITNRVVPGFLSMHDVETPTLMQPTDEQLQRDYIDKYKRRHQRLRELIQTTTDPIVFVRFSVEPMTNNEFRSFELTMNHINPDCNYRVVSLHESPLVNPPVHEPLARFGLLSVVPYRSKIARKEDWKLNYYKWSKIWRRVMR